MHWKPFYVVFFTKVLGHIGMYGVELICEMLCVLENATQEMNEEDKGNVHLTSVVDQGDWWQMVNLHLIDLDAGVSTRACGLFAKVWLWPSTWPHGLWSTRVRKAGSQLDRSHTSHNILQANPKFKWGLRDYTHRKWKTAAFVLPVFCVKIHCVLRFLVGVTLLHQMKWRLFTYKLKPTINQNVNQE